MIVFTQCLAGDSVRGDVPQQAAEGAGQAGVGGAGGGEAEAGLPHHGGRGWAGGRAAGA